LRALYAVAQLFRRLTVPWPHCSEGYEKAPRADISGTIRAMFKDRRTGHTLPPKLPSSVVINYTSNAQNFNERLAAHLTWGQSRERTHWLIRCCDKEIGSLSACESSFRNAGGLLGRVVTLARRIGRCFVRREHLHNRQLDCEKPKICPINPLN